MFALIMEYGTGKSKVICDEFGAREAAGGLHDLLVLAGAGSYLNWVEDKNESQPSEFHKHFSDDLNERLVAMSWVSGAGVRKMRELETLIRVDDRPRALVVNVEAFSLAGGKAFDLCWRFLTAPGRRSMMVVDESTLIKEESARRTENILKLAGEADVRRILTGLIVPNSPLDLYAQFMFLDWRILGHESIWTFKARYAIQKDIQVPIPGRKDKDGNQAVRKVKIVVGYRNEEELQERIAPYSYRVLSKECQDLPEQTYLPLIDVELTDEQKRHYRELKEHATTDLSEVSFVTATMVLTRNLRLQQLLCGFVTDDDGQLQYVPSNRGRALMELLENHSGKAIIWCPFLPALYRIVHNLEKVYGEGSVAQFHGENRPTRGRDEQRFLGDDKCRWMVSTPAAGGRGNTWNVATLMAYFANDYNLELRLNSEKRNHRDGQTQPVAIADFMTRGTNEMKVVQALRDKMDVAALIQGDDYRKWLI